MFPAATATTFGQIVAHREIFVIFSPLSPFGSVVLSFLTLCHGIRDRPEGKARRVPEPRSSTTVSSAVYDGYQ